MRVVSPHRKKLEPKRRFGGREFRSKVKSAANHKRIFSTPYPGTWKKFWAAIGLKSAAWRWGLLLVFLVLFYFFVVSSKFVVADIQISGNSQVMTQDIQDAVNEYDNSRFLLIKKGDFFFLTEGGLDKALTSQLPTVKEISQFHKTWPNKLSITITEHTPGFALKSDNNYFLVDDEGVIIKQIDDPGTLLQVEDSVVEDFATNEQLPNPQMAPFIISMAQEWSSKVSSSITAVKFPGKGADEVEFTSSDGWTVFFDTTRSASSELDNLALLLSQAIPANQRTNLAYIDLRVAKWAYYCYNNAPCQQQPTTPTASGASTATSTDTTNLSTTNAQP